jgi:hypothetical protein
MKQHWTRKISNSVKLSSVMLSEVRRQPNGVEAPHVYMQPLRPVEAFPPRLGGALWTVLVRALGRFATMYVQSLWSVPEMTLQVHLCLHCDGVLRLRSAPPHYAQDDSVAQDDRLELLDVTTRSWS